jgi:hypothetical protein
MGRAAATDTDALAGNVFDVRRLLAHAPFAPPVAAAVDGDGPATNDRRGPR